MHKVLLPSRADKDEKRLNAVDLEKKPKLLLDILVIIDSLMELTRRKR